MRMPLGLQTTVSENAPAPCRKRERRVVPQSSDDSNEESDGHFSLQNSDDDPETFSSSESENEEPENRAKYAVGDYIIVLYPGNGRKYPGIITQVLKNTVVVRCMEKKARSWNWPTNVDECEYKWENIVMKIKEPRKISKRNQYIIEELNEYV